MRFIFSKKRKVLRNAIGLTVFLFSYSTSYSQYVRESLSLSSRTLNKQVNYSIYLPEGYDNGSNRRFPVLYLLHGYTDNELAWAQFGDVEHIANKAIGTGDVSSMIIVMPDAGVSWYINDFAGKTRYEDFFIKEFIPFIDSVYRTRAKKEFRAVAGLSMGGLGTMIMATKHPELFAAAAPLSGAFWTDEEIINTPDDAWERYFSDLYGKGLKGKSRLNEQYQKNSILNIVKTGNVEQLKSVRYYIDCGDDDFLIKGNMALHAAMIDKKIPHEFRVREGGHTWSYWRTALPEVLKFISESFRR